MSLGNLACRYIYIGMILILTAEQVVSYSLTKKKRKWFRTHQTALSDMAGDSQIASVQESKGGGGGEELNLPTGYRFWPEENELISHYLTNKLLGRPLSANIIKDIDLYEYDPHQLPIGEFFFFLVYGSFNFYFFLVEI